MRYFERQDEESAKAYAAFCCYRDLGPENRSLQKAAETYYGCAKNVTQVGRWSRRYDWVERARAYDDFLEMERRSAIEEHLREHGGELARRAEAVQEEVLAVKEALIPKLKTMANWPLERATTTRTEEERDEDGRVVTVVKHVTVEPARWDFNSLIKALQTVDEKPARVDVRRWTEIDMDALSDEQLQRLADGEPPEDVLGGG